MPKSISMALVTVALACGCAGQVRDEDTSSDERAAGPVDLFAGDAPDAIVDAHARQLDGELLEIALLRALFELAKAHPGDARPWLLLARDSMQRDWVGFAVRQYASAIEADDRAAQDASVLADLIEVAASGAYGELERREASALIVDAWGARAVPAIDQKIAAMRVAGDRDAIGRMEALKAAALDAD